MNAFRQLLRAAGSKPPIGTWISSASPIVAEAMGHAGFDWGVVDMEHAPLDMMGLVHVLQALAGTKMTPVVRVPWNDAVMVKRVLDAGATTVLFPFVQSADDAARAVAATRYPPQGVRGMSGMTRASHFGTAPNYLKAADANMGVIVQLETPQALAQLEAIAAVDGVDAVFVGPADLSASLGFPAQFTHPQVMRALGDAARRCRALDKPVGSVGSTPEVVSQYRAMGFDYLAISSDMGLLMSGALAAVRALRSLSDGAYVHSLDRGTQTD
ncbi:MAG TPA: aldolase/citrate lyase family protein [Rubrivivax sp.]|nr:aldolase/citrate lyase family protein [Rubrivivax sp.]